MVDTNLDPSIAHLLDFSGRVVFITGASRGLGFAMSSAFHTAGASVVMISRTQDTLDNAASSLREVDADRVLTYAADVAREDEVAHSVAAALERWNTVDILVNNAALIEAGSVDDVDLERWRLLVDANLTGAYACVRQVAPVMEKNRFGRIINISSISGQTGGVSGGVHYAASKAGLLGMTKTLARDLGPYGITVNSITPGQIDTNPAALSEEQRHTLTAMIPLGRLGVPNDIAYAALFLASPMAAYITGATLDVNGGILKR